MEMLNKCWGLARVHAVSAFGSFQFLNPLRGWPYGSVRTGRDGHPMHTHSLNGSGGRVGGGRSVSGTPKHICTPKRGCAPTMPTERGAGCSLDSIQKKEKKCCLDDTFYVEQKQKTSWAFNLLPCLFRYQFVSVLFLLRGPAALYLIIYRKSVIPSSDRCGRVGRRLQPAAGSDYRSPPYLYYHR